MSDNPLHNPGDDPRIKIVRKTADQTVNNSAVLVADTDLVFPLGINQEWLLEIILNLNMLAASDFKWGLPLPALATIRWSCVYSLNNVQRGNASNFPVTVLRAVDNNLLTIRAIVINGANAGSAQLEWAQDTATAQDTTVQEGSVIIATRLN